MSDYKGSLDCLPIYSFLFPNEKGSSLYNAYNRNEVEDKLVIKIDQDVFGLPGIHECINGQKPLRAVIDIDASQEDMEITGVKAQEIMGGMNLIMLGFNRLLVWELKDWTIEEKDSENFVYFNRKAPLGCPLCKRIHDKDQQWFGRVCASSERFIIKCFRQNSDGPGDVFECDPSIAEKIQQKNKNISSAPSKTKGPGFPKAFVQMPSWAKYNEILTATETYKERYVRPLPNEGDIYVGSPWETGKTYVLEHLTIPDDVNLLVLSTRHSYSNAVTTRLNLKSYCDIDGNINLPDHKRKGKTFRLAPNKETVLAELWEWAKQMSLLPFENWTSASLICHLRKDVQEIVRTLKTDFPELRIKEYHGKTNSVEKAQDFSNVEESWKDVDLVAYTSTLKIGVSCINPKFERAFCIFNSYIETNAGTNQMLFRMRCIKDYICHIEQRSSNIPITEKGLFQWLLSAKRECLPRELQNRGIFPDIDSIIRNKDVPTIRLW
ncbi:hypothetical protein RhiirC2_716168, partial [Rhizophagus irregularis]